MGSVTAAIRHQRSEGAILLSMGPWACGGMREAHSAKVRIPHGSREAILINTGGGLAGGDRFSFDITAEENARLTVTSQAAERVYRSLGARRGRRGDARRAAGASLMWLPQETILFDGAALTRRIDADLAEDARFLAVESVILGREAMGETVHHARLHDRWRVRRNGRLIFADDLAFDGTPPGDARPRWARPAPSPPSCWSLPMPRTSLDKVRDAIGSRASASAWSGKLVARLVGQRWLRAAQIPDSGAHAAGGGCCVCLKFGHSEEKSCN